MQHRCGAAYNVLLVLTIHQLVRVSSMCIMYIQCRSVLQITNYAIYTFKGEVYPKIKFSPVVVFGVLSRMVLVRGS